MMFYFALALRRLQSRISLTALLIFTIALTIAILVCVPVFSNAVSMQLMEQSLSERNLRYGRPAFALRAYILPSDNKMSIQDNLDRREWLLALVKIGVR